MAAQVMSIGSAGSFLDSPGFNHKRTKIPPSGFNRREIGPPIRFDGGDFGEDLATPSYSSTSQVNTPDSGFSGTASCSLLKTPESDICSSAAATPSSSGSAATHRKRKTVNFDESQTCVVVISPDDLFNTYSKNQSESLESRDNPFLPGGELSREAEDLLRRATIIRDNFYLNEEEKRTLQEHQQQQQQQQQQHQQQQKQRSAKKVQIIDQDGQTYDSEKQPSSPTYPGNVEERISPQSAGNTLAAVPQGDGLQPKENGKAADGAAASPDNVKLTIPDSDGQSIPLTQSGPGGGLSGDLQVHDSDKKRRNKCCSIM